MRWQCQCVDSNGVRCENEALHRIQFSQEHPFDHVDVCEKHLESYNEYLGVVEENNWKIQRL